MNNKKINFIRISLLDLVISIFIILICRLLKVDMEENFWQNFWQNFWTVQTGVITAILAIYGIKYQMNYDRYTKNSEKIEYEKEKSAEKYEEKLRVVNQEGSKTLIEWQEYLNKNNSNESKMNFEIVRLLYQYDELNQAAIRFNINGEGDSSKEVTDIVENSVLLTYNINNAKSRQMISKIRRDFPDLEQIISTFLNREVRDNIQNKLVDVINKENDIDELNLADNQNQENNGERIYPSILGDWIMKEEYAEEVKYLVGISIATKKILAIYRLPSANKLKMINDRVRFNGKDGEIIFDGIAKDNEEQVNLLLEWSSRNPVLYYNTWAKDKEGSNDLPDLIKNIEGKDRKISLKENRAILVVKTNQYD